MAKVVWPKRALADLDKIAAYIRQYNPAAATSMKDRLFALGESLAYFPHRGRLTLRGARELTNVPPYVLRYRIDGDTVIIVHVRHGRRRRPLR